MSEPRPTLQYATPTKHDGVKMHEIIETSLYILAAGMVLALGLFGVRWLSGMIVWRRDPSSAVEFVEASVTALVGIVLFIVFGWQAGAPWRRREKDVPDAAESKD